MLNRTPISSVVPSILWSGANCLPVVCVGVAAPFTSRIPSVRAVVDLIRQGRCTLLSALMQQQIMMLESCIAAYTLSALSLHNARSSVSGPAGLNACLLYVLERDHRRQAAVQSVLRVAYTIVHNSLIPSLY